MMFKKTASGTKQPASEEDFLLRETLAKALPPNSSGFHQRLRSISLQPQKQKKPSLVSVFRSLPDLFSLLKPVGYACAVLLLVVGQFWYFNNPSGGNIDPQISDNEFSPVSFESETAYLEDIFLQNSSLAFYD